MVFFEFNKKIVLITGAAGGIGSALCRKFLENNAIVYQTDIQHIDNPNFIQGDISDQEFIKKLVKQIIDKEGRIDILINNAGICPRTAVLDISFDEWRKVLDVNLTSIFFLSQAVLKIMIKNKSGAIVNLASVAGQIGGIAVGAHYSASKAAIECLTKTFAKNGAPYGIRVNAVAPGVIDTEIHKKLTREQLEQYKQSIPLGRMGTAEEVANIILVLASDLASFLTGTTIDINGGQKM
ncbi:MAG: SDR family NAD(P)-dependent oxidoreductase [Bacteroidota bacterium]|nr:SDR family NAD(P)-dependent oxidoreductase [Bacteroidota bacterium]